MHRCRCSSVAASPGTGVPHFLKRPSTRLQGLGGKFPGHLPGGSLVDWRPFFRITFPHHFYPGSSPSLRSTHRDSRLVLHRQAPHSLGKLRGVNTPRVFPNTTDKLHFTGYLPAAVCLPPRTTLLPWMLIFILFLLNRFGGLPNNGNFVCCYSPFSSIWFCTPPKFTGGVYSVPNLHWTHSVSSTGTAPKIPGTFWTLCMFYNLGLRDHFSLV